jgi:hypothetical protein
MWQMTLKQRRRYNEMMRDLDKLKKDPYLRVPAGYEEGKNLEEDERYRSTIKSFQSLVEEIHALEELARKGN